MLLAVQTLFHGVTLVTKCLVFKMSLKCQRKMKNVHNQH